MGVGNFCIVQPVEMYPYPYIQILVNEAVCVIQGVIRLLYEQLWSY